MARRGFIIAGLSSSSGKTSAALGLLGAFRRAGFDVSGAKVGPDYIDGGFHLAASGTASVNLDGYSMSPDLLGHLSRQQSGDLLIIEGVMGLYDGGSGSTAQLAAHLGLPLVLVLDIRGQSETAAVIAASLKEYLARQNIALAGVILNRSQSHRHSDTIKTHCQQLGITVFGIIADDAALSLPSRHLGLVQAMDLDRSKHLKSGLDGLAAAVSSGVNLDQLAAAAAILPPAESIPAESMPPFGQHIAVAYDAAFGFAYPHLLSGWRRQGAMVSLFSPLADEPPNANADAIFLPGGYPELHLGALSGAKNFARGMHHAAAQNIPIYGECGGYMVLGRSIISAAGDEVPILGLLDLVTSFKAPKRILGYRSFELLSNQPSILPRHSRGHEFHFTQAIFEQGEKLFRFRDKNGLDLGEHGLKSGSVFGSYGHLIAAV